MSPRRDRSPSFPYIPLAAAIDRTRQLYEKAKRYEARIADAATAWQLGTKSSSTLQTAAALLAFGLAEDSGSGEGRKIKVSDLGWRILEDKRPGAWERGLAEAALKPKMIAEYATEHWKDGRPDDGICISELMIERGFNDEAAARFLRVFDATIRYAGLRDSDSLPDSKTESAGLDNERKHDPVVPPPTLPKVGDYVRWASAPFDQRDTPRQIIRIAEEFAFVHGSPTGMPMNELTIADPPRVPPLGGTSAETPKSASSADASRDGDLNVLLRGNRLEITADVDRAGLQRLKEILGKYEEILKIIDPSSGDDDA